MNIDDAIQLQRAREIEQAARYTVQQHARLHTVETALVQIHAELDATPKGPAHGRVEMLMAATRRAARHYRRLLDAGVQELRAALGLPATPTPAEALEAGVIAPPDTQHQAVGTQTQTEETTDDLAKES